MGARKVICSCSPALLLEWTWNIMMEALGSGLWALGSGLSAAGSSLLKKKRSDRILQCASRFSLSSARPLSFSPPLSFLLHFIFLEAFCSLFCFYIYFCFCYFFFFRKLFFTLRSLRAAEYYQISLIVYYISREVPKVSQVLLIKLNIPTGVYII
jgi:hypothetical protein